MKEFALIFGKEAAPKVRGGSYADGIAVLENWERLVKSTSSALSQNKMEHLPLIGQTLLNHQLWRASNNFSSLKSTTKLTISSGIASSCSSVRETLPFPNKTRSRGHLVRQTAFSRTESTPFSVREVLSTACGTEIGLFLYERTGFGSGWVRRCGLGSTGGGGLRGAGYSKIISMYTLK